VPSEPKVFLSHAAADIELIEVFETLLSKAVGIPSSRIFCSSLEGQGVPKGQDFVAYIRGEVEKADVVVALITPAYLDSAFCMAELGAAWVLGTHRFPIVVPPIGFDAVNATQLGLTAVKLDNQDSLSQMLEDLNNALDIELPKDGVRRRALKGFQKAWEELRSRIAGPQRVAHHVHAALQDECRHLRDQVTEADEQIERLEEINEKLRAAKDREAVAEIDAEYVEGNLEDTFKELIESVTELQDDLGGPAVLEHAIMDHFDRAGKIDWTSYEDQFDIAVKYGVYDPDTNSIMWGNEDLAALSKALDALQSFLQENHNASFLTKDDRRGPEDLRFWQKRL